LHFLIKKGRFWLTQKRVFWMKEMSDTMRILTSPLLKGVRVFSIFDIFETHMFYFL